MKIYRVSCLFKEKRIDISNAKVDSIDSFTNFAKLEMSNYDMRYLNRIRDGYSYLMMDFLSKKDAEKFKSILGEKYVL